MRELAQYPKQSLVGDFGASSVERYAALGSMQLKLISLARSTRRDVRIVLRQFVWIRGDAFLAQGA
jgi:hypothetical protein